MDLSARVAGQRVRHIIDSYQLDGRDREEFARQLDELLRIYPTPDIELAIVETLVAQWFHPPILKGIPFLQATKKRLLAPATPSSITPAHFQHITGLDPAPIFGDRPHPSAPNSTSPSEAL